MKPSACLFPITVFLLIIGALQSQEPVTPMDRAKRSMAIRAAAKRIIEDSNTLLDAPQKQSTLREKMAAFMRADIIAHQNRDASRRLCLDYAHASIRDLLISNVVLAVDDASQHSPLPMTIADVLANVDSNWTGAADQAAVGFTKRHFESVFDEARKNVTANQRFETEKRIAYPPYQELNKELTRLTGKKAPLTSAEFEAVEKWWSNLEFKKIQPLFEEVQSDLNATFKSIGNAIAVQYEKQRLLFREAGSDRNDIERYLSSAGIYERIVSVCRAKLRPSDPAAPPGGGLSAPIYELFDVIDADIRKTADKKETEYFSDYIRSLTNLPVSTSALETAILSDPAAHKSALQSGAVLNKIFAGDLSGWVASNYVLRPHTDALVRNDATVKYFAGQLSVTGAALASLWGQCVQRALATPLAAARAEIAQRQADKYFSGLNSAQNLPENIVDRLAEQRNFAGFKTMAELTESLPELTPAPKNTEGLLEETEALAMAGANKLNTAAEQAVRGQERGLWELEKEMLPQLEQQVAERKPVSEISSAWSAELSKRWMLQAQNINSPYRTLLGRTSALLNKTVRQLYDAKLAKTEKPRATPDSAKQASQVKQEEPSLPMPRNFGGASEADAKTSKKTKGDISADLFLVIRDIQNNACEALLETADGLTLAKTTFKPDQAEHAAEQIFSAFRADIHDTMAAKLIIRKGAFFGLFPARRSVPKEISIYIVAPSARVRLKTSLLIREQIENLIAQWAQAASSPTPKLRWGTGFAGDSREKPEK